MVGVWWCGGGMVVVVVVEVGKLKQSYKIEKIE